MKYYTGIGSRDTPHNILQLMEDIAIYLYIMGYTLRSGGADGADTAFEMGAKRGRSLVIKSTQNPYSYFYHQENMIIYLPWGNFNNRTSDGLVYKDSSKLPAWNDALLIAKKIHPVFDRLTRGAKLLHIRNVFQVLGSTLNKPSDFIICYTDPSYTKGGTRTAVKLGMNNNIPIWNLAIPEIKQLIEYWLYTNKIEI